MSASTPSPSAEPSLGTSDVVSALFWSALPLTIVSLLASAWGVFGHLRHFTMPAQQRYVVRILLMVPVYGTVAQVGIGFPWAARYLELFRDWYEALVIYAFFMLLVEYIGGEQQVPRVFNMRRLPDPGNEAELTDAAAARRTASADADDVPIDLSEGPPPSAWRSWMVTLGRLLFFWRPDSPDEDPKKLFLSIKRGILQFVVLMPFISVATVISDLFAVFEEGDFSPEESYLWLSIIHIVSVTVAMIYLIRFYNIAARELKPYRPLPKFLCIKAVVFLSFYQNFVLSIVFSVIDTHDLGFTASTLQNFLICIEMSVAAVAHLLYFPASEYEFSRLQAQPLDEEDEPDNEDTQLRKPQQKFGPPSTIWNAFMVSFLCSDIYSDTVRTFGPRGQLVEPLMTHDLDEDIIWKDEAAAAAAASSTRPVHDLADEEDDEDDPRGVSV